MKITIAKVQSMNPCKDRFSNFVDNNPGFKGNVKDFLSLENITYSDKIWVCVRLMTRNQKYFWARATAYSVLEIFEKHRPNDKRVRELLEFLNTIDDIEKITPEQLTQLRTLRDGAYSARCAAYAAAAYAAAAYAYAAASAYAAAAAYAASAYAAYAAAHVTQEQINLILLALITEMDI